MPQKQYKFIPTLLGGIDKSRRGDSLKDDQGITLDNVFFDNDYVRSDTGYGRYGTVTVTGIPQKIFHAKHADGTEDVLLVTTTRLYQLSGTEWVYVPWSDRANTASTTLSADANAGDTTITVASISNFNDTNPIGIVLDDGTQHETTINGAPSGSTITLTDAIPSGANATSGNAVARAYVLTGSVTDPVDVVNIPSLAFVIITNNQDSPLLFDKTKVYKVSELASSDMDATLGASFKAKTVDYFNNHLFFFNTEESGTRYPQRIRWCATADLADWNGTDAGFNDLVETADFIEGAEQLGPYLIVYKGNSIVRGDYVGSVDQLVSYRTVVQDEGIHNHQCVVDRGDHHLVFGNKHVFKYTGGFTIEDIGREVHDLLYGSSKELNLSKDGTFATAYIDELNEFWVMYVKTGSTYNDKILRYNTRYKSWSVREFADTILSATPYVTTSTLVLLCGSDNRVYDYDFSTTNDDGAKITWTYETKDYFIPQRRINVTFIDLLMKGHNVLIEISTDRGDTYQSIQRFSGDTTEKKVRIHYAFSADHFRIRFSSSSINFYLGWIGFEYYIHPEE